MHDQCSLQNELLYTPGSIAPTHMKISILLTGRLRLVAKPPPHGDVLGMLVQPIRSLGRGQRWLVDILNQVQTFYLGYSVYGYPSFCQKK